MTILGFVLLLLPIVLFLYAYVGYPLLMWIISRGKYQALPNLDPPEWPEITIVLPVYNEERAVAATIESLLGLSYPPALRNVLVVSDASTDGTDEIVRGYADRGVRLVRLARRGGKTAAENEAGAHLRGTIVVNTDATIRIMPESLKALIRVFQNPQIGLASGRDLSVGDLAREGNQGESGYVSYEMWVRSLETDAGTIVGASGCFYAIRRELFDRLFPEALSRDFASAMIAAEHNLRSVSVKDAVCLVPRTLSLRSEYRRKVRTMARGLETLWYKRPLLSGEQADLFRFQLLSHKLIRWLVFLIAPLCPIGLLLIGVDHTWPWPVLGLMAVSLALGGVAFLWPEGRRVPRLFSFFGFLVGAEVAGFVAWTKALRRELNPIWEPTRRA